MLLDLFSTIVGALIAIFAVALLASIWTRTAKPKKISEKIRCPFIFDGSCPKECEKYELCEAERKSAFEYYV